MGAAGGRGVGRRLGHMAARCPGGAPGTCQGFRRFKCPEKVLGSCLTRDGSAAPNPSAGDEASPGIDNDEGQPAGEDASRDNNGEQEPEPLNGSLPHAQPMRCSVYYDLFEFALGWK